MKKILLLLFVVASIVMPLHCMENSLAVQVGAFTHRGCAHKPQRDRFDIKSLNGAIGLGLFDGHAGKKVSTELKEYFFDDFACQLNCCNGNAMKTFKEVVCMSDFDARVSDHRYDKLLTQGSSLIAAWLDPKIDKANVVCVGDSVAILIKNNHMSITPIHRYANISEKERIMALCSTMKDNLFGQLTYDHTTLSRSIGHQSVKYVNSYLLSSEPDCYEYIMQDADYLILVTKGLYDVLNSTDDAGTYKDFQEIFSHALSLSDKNFHHLYPLPSGITLYSEEISDSAESCSEENDSEELEFGLQNVTQDPCVQEIAKRLVQVALSRGSKDNITVVVSAFTSNSDYADASTSNSEDLNGVD